MLARNAESLYWIGRYVERADDTARILDVSVHELLEDATVHADTAARRLLGVLGVVPGTEDPLDAWSLTELVGYSYVENGQTVEVWDRLHRDPANPDRVLLGFVALPLPENVSYRISTFNAAGDSALSPQTFVL